MNLRRATIQLQCVAESTEFARGDQLLKALAKAGGKTSMDMAETPALIAAMKGSKDAFVNGAASAGRKDLTQAPASAMAGTRNFIAGQARFAKAAGALKPADSLPLLPGADPVRNGFQARGRAAAEAVADVAAPLRQSMISGSASTNGKRGYMPSSGYDTAGADRQGLISAAGSVGAPVENKKKKASANPFAAAYGFQALTEVMIELAAKLPFPPDVVHK